ncbi:prepilin peptidase [Macrococcus brunensis]|uniref:prepilin peptidase n=1 Tax=Macrococcus brunensis TaxID=198483 RepID=UPI001EEFC9F1|nr:prepilin peptidase [Macrococcus brunensis]ULG71226.1 prepilin peptidase [Macrococcus brunensis]
MFIAVIGSFIGSFMLCLTYQEGSLFRRSQCDSCHSDLVWYELIPVVSFIMQKGRCRQCNNQIPLHIFMTELLFFMLFLLFFSESSSALYAACISFLVPLAIYDIHHFKVPNHMLLLFACILLLIRYPLLFDIQHLVYSVLLIILLHLFYLLTGSIGYGDIKLLSLFALFLPLTYFLLIFMLTYFIGGIAVICFLFYKHNLKKIPLIPFITASTLLVFKFYDELYTIYFGGFL